MGLRLSHHQRDFVQQVRVYRQTTGSTIKVLALAGPNGSGKSTIIREILRVFPDKFTSVSQVSTRPPRKDDIGRRFVSESEFKQCSIILSGVAGIYKHGYTCADLMNTIRSGKILIFEGMTRIKKLIRLLPPEEMGKHMIVGVLPPGDTMKEMIAVLRDRLLARKKSKPADIEKKLKRAQLKLIPEVFAEAEMIVRSAGFRTALDVKKIISLWNKKTKDKITPHSPPSPEQSKHGVLQHIQAEALLQ